MNEVREAMRMSKRYEPPAEGAGAT
jgi:hypothetical protein